MTRIKICGITRLEDAQGAVNAGAHALGFVLADSPRQVMPGRVRQIVRELPPMVTTVGVFVDAPPAQIEAILNETGVHMAQLHGQERPQYCASLSRRVIKRIQINEQSSPETLLAEMRRYNVAGYLLDPGAGGGRRFDWSRFAGLGVAPSHTFGSGGRYLIVAGGLDPKNVCDAIKLMKPYAVDVCTGVEAAPGRKDIRKVRAFVRAVEQADAVNAT